MSSQPKDCALCGGTGWKPVAATAADPLAAEKKKSPQVTRCDCRTGARSDLLLAKARIPARYEHCSLADFSTHFDANNTSLANARLKAGRFVEEYPVEKTGLLFIGTIGVGKTHLAVGIIRELVLQKGIPCLFYDYRELLKEIQNSYNPDVSATELSILRPVFETEVLVLDELGAVKPSEWVWDTVSLIINSRYNEKRTTIFTTNYEDRPAAAAEPVNNLAKRVTREESLGDRIGERMRSRLHEMCRKVEMTGSDFRQRVQSANFR